MGLGVSAPPVVAGTEGAGVLTVAGAVGMGARLAAGSLVVRWDGAWVGGLELVRVGLGRQSNRREKAGLVTWQKEGE